ncbi:hypothetical protein SKAU_G00018640 [Synaphobranchus kaupii]|uniref:Uncharacterized protein n=1 Tax=Synaphobranchus kaupii TaxID=118154 RepID=A0A9Q1JBZ5_SYNKA|nr:hypothetical protein SKAU_G00018640 [Synaphobranchus kaupii]
MRLKGTLVITRASKGVWRGMLGRCNWESRSMSIKFPSAPESTGTETTWIRPSIRREADSKEWLGDFCKGVTLTSNPLATGGQMSVDPDRHLYQSIKAKAIDFRTLATTSGWNQEAQYDAFLHGLNDDKASYWAS